MYCTVRIYFDQFTRKGIQKHLVFDGGGETILYTFVGHINVMRTNGGEQVDPIYA